MASPTWVLDTSSLIILRSLFSRDERARIVAALATLVADGRLVFPREVVIELERYAGADNPALQWAKEQQGAATAAQPSFDSVARVLEQVPEILDPDKDGTDEADPYVLAMALDLFEAGGNIRVVTEEFKTTVAKMPLGSAAGLLGIPSVSLKSMLKFERIADFA